MNITHTSELSTRDVSQYHTEPNAVWHTSMLSPALDVGTVCHSFENVSMALVTGVEASPVRPGTDAHPRLGVQNREKTGVGGEF